MCGAEASTSAALERAFSALKPLVAQGGAGFDQPGVDALLPVDAFLFDAALFFDRLKSGAQLVQGGDDFGFVAG